MYVARPAAPGARLAETPCARSPTRLPRRTVPPARHCSTGQRLLCRGRCGEVRRKILRLCVCRWGNRRLVARWVQDRPNLPWYVEWRCHHDPLTERYQSPWAIAPLAQADSLPSVGISEPLLEEYADAVVASYSQDARAVAEDSADENDLYRRWVAARRSAVATTAAGPLPARAPAARAAPPHVARRVSRAAAAAAAATPAVRRTVARAVAARAAAADTPARAATPAVRRTVARAVAARAAAADTPARAATPAVRRTVARAVAPVAAAASPAATRAHSAAVAAAAVLGHVSNAHATRAASPLSPPPTNIFDLPATAERRSSASALGLFGDEPLPGAEGSSGGVDAPRKLREAEYDFPRSCHAVGLLYRASPEGRKAGLLSPLERELQRVVEESSAAASQPREDADDRTDDGGTAAVAGREHAAGAVGDLDVRLETLGWFGRCFGVEAPTPGPAADRRGLPPQKVAQQVEGDDHHATSPDPRARATGPGAASGPHGTMSDSERRQELDKLRALYQRRVDEMWGNSSDRRQMTVAERRRIRSRLTSRPHRERKGSVYA